MEIGDHSRIDDFCVLSVTLKSVATFTSRFSPTWQAAQRGVTLDDFSGLAYRCQVRLQSDDYSGATLTNPTVLAQYKREIKKANTVGRHVIVGANSIVFQSNAG